MMRGRIASSVGDYSAPRIPPSAMTLLSSRRTATLLLFVAFAVRVIAIDLHPVTSALYSDMDNYRQTADNVLAGQWKQSHFLQAIGFALILAVFKRLFT